MPEKLKPISPYEKRKQREVVRFVDELTSQKKPKEVVLTPKQYDRMRWSIRQNHDLFCDSWNSPVVIRWNGVPVKCKDRGLYAQSDAGLTKHGKLNTQSFTSAPAYLSIWTTTYA